MNFNSFIRDLQNYKELNKSKPLWVPELYKKLKPLFDMFIKESNEVSLEGKSYGLLDKADKNKFKGYQKFQKKFKTFMDVCLTIMNDYGNSTKAYFKNAKYKPISHGCFHNWKKFFTKLIWKKSIVWPEHFNKSTRPNTIEYKYSISIRKIICDKYFNYDPLIQINFRTLQLFEDN